MYLMLPFCSFLLLRLIVEQLLTSRFISNDKYGADLKVVIHFLHEFKFIIDKECHLLLTQQVLKDRGDSKKAWFSASVLSLKDGEALVCYDGLQSDEGQSLMLAILARN